MSIFGNSFKADKSGKFGQYFIIGRVKSIVQGPFTRSIQAFITPDGLPAVRDVLEPNPDFTSWKDVGKIRYEIMYSNLSESKQKIWTAFSASHRKAQEITDQYFFLIN